MMPDSHEHFERVRGRKLYKMLLPYRPKACKTVLDMGCGDGIKAAEYHKGLIVGGVEANLEKATQAAQAGLAWCKCADMTKVNKLLRLKPDWITFIDSLEHISQAEASALLDKCRHFVPAITIFVPEGDTSGWRKGREGLDEHLSAWYPADFEALGFTVKRLVNYHGRGRNAMIAHWEADETFPITPASTILEGL